MIEKISGWLEVANNIQAIRDALNNSPVPCGMIVREDFMAYTSGVYEYSWGDKLGGHVVLIVGVDDEPEVIIDGTPTIGAPCWIVKNSWGTGWRERRLF